MVANFDKNDANNTTNDTNLLLNLKFEASKDNLKLESVVEVGELYFGDSATGGNQGLRGKNVEIRNLNLQEQYGENWSFKVGLWTMNADPRGFVFSDGLTGASLNYDTKSSESSLWAGAATAPTPTVRTQRDTYIGLKHNQIFDEDRQMTAFLTYRSTRENFTDKDLTTNLAGQSKYVWVGAHYDQQNFLGDGHLELNAILNRSEFKTENGGPSDSNNSWLAHAHVGYKVQPQWMLGADLLATSGSDTDRAAGLQVIGERKNFSSPAPSSAYLLTIATSDSADDAAGSTRTNTGNQIGRLDLDHGLRMGIFSLEGILTENWIVLVRYGQIKTAVKNKTTDSDDYGREVDLRVKFKASAYTSWILEAGLFDPGSYFVNQDNAKLVSLAYRLDF